MPKIKSAIKRVEITDRNRSRNKSWKSAVRTAKVAVEDSISVADRSQAATNLSRLYAVIDRAVIKGILHINTAARKKSRLASLVCKLSQAGK